MNLYLRYALEFAIIIPAAIFAFMPVSEHFKINSFIVYGLTSIFLACFIAAGAFFKSKAAFIPGLLGLFLIYYFCVDMQISKKLFCFFNAVMLCAICPAYTIILMGPFELENESGVFLLESGFMNLAIALLMILIFIKTAYKRIPVLLNEERINAIWDYLFLIPLVMTILIYWATPVSPRVVMTGRVRAISLFLFALIPTTIFILYYIFWWITAKLTESTNLQQENILLRLESKRYDELKSYIDHAKILRHDFRQHLHVISELADEKKINELQKYLSQLNDSSGTKYMMLCSNSAVNAIASHYDLIARKQDTKISWRLEIPSVLPVKESDFCAVLGNLTENALKAVKNLDSNKRNINIISSMLSDSMLGLSIDNPFEGAIKFNKNGLPLSSGIGLSSVSNIVGRYGGSLNINTDNNIFSAGLIFYINNV